MRIKIFENIADTLHIWKKIRKISLENPFFTYKWHKNYYESFPREGKPFIIYLSDLEILAPFIVHQDIWKLSGGQEISDYQDIIGPPENFNKSWPILINVIRKLKGKKLLLHNISNNSRTLSFFLNNNLKKINAEITKEDSTPYLNLTDKYEEYLLSLNRKNRHELKRKIKKFESENRDCVIENFFNPSGDINILLDLMLRNQKKRVFLTPEIINFFVNIYTKVAVKCVMHVLNVQNIPQAATLSFVNKSELMLYNSGFNEASCSGSGFYLKSKLISWAIKNGFKKFNFLQGKEKYKYDLGAVDFFVYTIITDI